MRDGQPTTRPPLAILLGAGVVAMIPWPMLGVTICIGMLDQANEAYLLLGGVTGLVIAPLLLPLQAPDALFSAVILGVWISAWLVPPIVMLRKNWSTTTSIVVVLGQSLFSFSQAAMGVLIIFGKGV